LLIIFNWEELDIDERIILKWILKEYNGDMDWIIWMRMISVGVFWKGY